eukprot:CAMPEP_0171928002 /NCGR_PEP_ID=MMETSP0993-20121228/26356_1 /TAXON_ID=483369 /ORGANISM="non described non described, Strain CCMP2098" /LENGTH=45 /DNA_ID= /DNA_START= /DNA_END= /DNA_ORIENTATION=
MTSESAGFRRELRARLQDDDDDGPASAPLWVALLLLSPVMPAAEL